MGKTSADKFLGFVKRGSLHRVKSYLKRGKVDVNHVLNKKQRTALHVACFLGEDAVVKTLLKYGTDPALVDEDGNTAVVLALKYTLEVRSRVAYEDLVKPLLRVSGTVLDVKNKDGETARGILDEVKAVLREYDRERQREEKMEESFLEERRNRDDEEEWREKLFFEMGADMPYDDESWVEDDGYENYDQWADRIHHEFSKKHRNKRQENENAHSKRRDEKEEKAKEETERLQKEHDAYLEMVSKKRKEKQNEKSKKLYDSRCERMFDPTSEEKLTYDSMPWPCPGSAEDMVKKLVVWSEQCDGRKYMKEQQVRWHPDRFLQRCGSRMIESDKERVVEVVKKISQELNSYIQEHIK